MDGESEVKTESKSERTISTIQTCFLNFFVLFLQRLFFCIFVFMLCFKSLAWKFILKACFATFVNKSNVMTKKHRWSWSVDVSGP